MIDDVIKGNTQVPGASLSYNQNLNRFISNLDGKRFFGQVAFIIAIFVNKIKEVHYEQKEENEKDEAEKVISEQRRGNARKGSAFGGDLRAVFERSADRAIHRGAGAGLYRICRAQKCSKISLPFAKKEKSTPLSIPASIVNHLSAQSAPNQSGWARFVYTQVIVSF